MVFTSPIWLLALLPWGAATAWLLWGRRRRQPVPFLALWQGPVTSPRSTRSLQTPPLALALAIGAILLAIFAASRPVVMFLARPAMDQPITIIVDRGITMSARWGNDVRQPGFAALAESIAPMLREQLGNGPIELIDVPSGAMRMYDSKDWARQVGQLPPTAVDTSAQLPGVVEQRLHDSQGAIIVLSDHAVDAKSGRVVQIVPRGLPANVGLVRVAASMVPSPQIMIGVRNQSDLSEAVLRITSAGRTIDIPIHLPPRNAQRNYFQDVAKLDDVINVKVLASDDLDADNEAWLVREQHHPRIEMRSPAPPALNRMIEVYERHNPPSGDAQPLAVVQSPGELGPQEGGVLLAAVAEADGGAPAASNAPPLVTDHPVTAIVDWQKISAGARVASWPPPGEGWTPVVRFGDRPAVAVREAPRREVWIGFASSTWPRTGDYVVFWSNVFDWLGAGLQADAFVGHPIAALGPEWRAIELAQIRDDAGASRGAPGLWPGLYELADHSAKRGVNALDVQINAPPGSDSSRAKLAAIALARKPRFDAASLLLLLAGGCMMMAALTWRRSARALSAAEIAAGGAPAGNERNPRVGR